MLMSNHQEGGVHSNCLIGNKSKLVTTCASITFVDDMVPCDDHDFRSSFSCNYHDFSSSHTRQAVMRRFFHYVVVLSFLACQAVIK